MKKLSLLVVVIAATAACFAGSYEANFRYDPGSLKLGEERGYTTVEYAGAVHRERLGSPDLPVLPQTVLIPADAELTDVEILELETEPVAGSYDVLPVQHPVPYREDAPEQPFVGPDPVVYSADAFYPASVVSAGRSGNKAGYRLVSFGVYPVRYNPVERRLELVRRLRVRVSYDRGAGRAKRATATQLALHGAAVRNLVLNAGDVARFAPPERKTGRGSAFLPAGTFEHVIITRSAWADSLQRLAAWRTRQGWRSTVMLLEDICATYPGRDTAEMMREFIKDADTTWGTVFVFLARDDYPAHQYRVVRAYNYNLFSDMYFSDLDGDWDANGNNVFGENADNVDGYADVFVGMITLNSHTELSNYLDKVFRYELSPDTTGGWMTKMLLPNGVTFSNEFNDSIAIASPSPPWFDLKMYSSGGMVQPTGQKYCDSLNSGYSLSSIIAHGSPDLYQLGSNVTSSMVLALTNTNRMNFGTFVCCNTGEWNLGSTNGDCIAENMVFHAPAGHIGVAMNYESGWVRVAEFFNYSIMYGALGYRAPRQVTMGEALSFGKDYWVWCLEDSAKWRMEAFERNLFGAPAVPLWTGPAFVANVTAPGAVNVGTGIPVQVTVNTPSWAPVESALVCIHKDGETHDYAWTDASGQVTLTSDCLTPGHLQLTVTCANNLPHLDSIPVVAAGRFVAYLRHAVNDSTGGNGDGIINPGESVRIPTWVKNYGDSTANSVTAKLITHATGVTMTDSTASFGNIGANDSALDANAFAFTVAAGLPNGYPIPCSLVSRDNAGGQWVTYVTFNVGAPMMSYVSQEVFDQGGSQPNGRLDPGETAELEVTIINSGIGNAYNVWAVARSTDPRLTFPDSTGVYGTVPAGSTRVNTGDRFTVTANSSIPPETAVECTLDILGDNGYASHHAFTIVVGEVRVIDPIPDGPRQPAVYWAFDDTDTGYAQAPEFNWVEISGVGTRLTLSDDQTVVVNLGAFGPFVFYGQSYSQLSVCGNGFVCPGSQTYSGYSNQALPYSSAPGMLALNWDDLYPPTGGGVWWYHDAANHRFIVEWDSVAYYSPRETRDKFQLVIYDTTQAGPDGNSRFVYQYLTSNQNSSCTVGEQDHTKTVSIQTLYNGSYHRGASPLAAGTAILFTTESPTTGIAEQFSPLSLERRRLVVAPNPFSRNARVHWHLPRESDVDIKVFDATGRAVRTLVTGCNAAGSHSALWNGADDDGRRLAHGVYFVRLQTPDNTVKVKTILTR